LPAPFGEGDGVVAQYEGEMAAFVAAHPITPPAVVLSDDALQDLSRRPEVIAAGKVVYDANCAVCHRPDGGGLIGPNLTDDAWLHGSSPTAIRTTISTGVLAKGMPAWERILTPDQVNAVAAYVVTLRGTRPTAPKAPEGTVEPAKP
jgi:cytochrome c oxidase cbb3-type subunit 3